MHCAELTGCVVCAGADDDGPTDDLAAAAGAVRAAAAAAHAVPDDGDAGAAADGPAADAHDAARAHARGPDEARDGFRRQLPCRRLPSHGPDVRPRGRGASEQLATQRKNRTPADRAAFLETVEVQCTRLGTLLGLEPACTAADFVCRVDRQSGTLAGQHAAAVRADLAWGGRSGGFVAPVICFELIL
eukprot:2721768-Rhodomonas_salina.2